MRLLVPNEGRFLQSPDGAIWTRGPSTYRFWQRYLDVFDSVKVLARVGQSLEQPEGAVQANGQHVSFAPLPYYKGPQQYLLRRKAFLEAMAKTAASNDAFLLRAPGQIAATFGQNLPDDRPYGIEVIGDPRDLFAPGAVRHPLRPFFQWWFAGRLRKLVSRASAVSYVTETALQYRYPAPDDAFTTHYSSIELPASYFVLRARDPGQVHRPLRCVTVGSLELPYKGVDLVIEAIASLNRDGQTTTLEVIGEGKYRAALERQARSAGMSESVRFLGHLGAETVQDRLDSADVFVLASRTEGLPRAMIEAMARALPCIGTSVGGIPELLDHENLVPPNDADALARRLEVMATDPDCMARASRLNLERAHEYELETLRQRRVDFYAHLKELTSEWLSRTKQ